MFPRLRKLIVQYFIDMRWYNILLALLIYAVSSWVLLFFAGENSLLKPDEFIYWLIVTSSTVGYGDLSPQTSAGKYLVALYIIPAGLSIFALVVGRAAAFVSEQWHKGVRGLKDLNVKEHVLVIGWNQQRTLNLLDLLLTERSELQNQPEIVLCVRADIVNPLPGKVEFVRVSSFNRDEDMRKACVNEASVIIMDNPEDDLTMTTALYCAQANPNAHKIAYFRDESLVKLLQTHCPDIECTPSVAVEMLAKSAFDPGSSQLHYDLLSVREGQAQYSVAVPEDCSPLAMANIFSGLKAQHNATLIGYSQANTSNIELNPALDILIKPGDKIFYIAESRINQIQWHAM